MASPLSIRVSLVPWKFFLYWLAPTSLYKGEFDWCLYDHWCPLLLLAHHFLLLTPSLKPAFSLGFILTCHFPIPLLGLSIHVYFLGQMLLLVADTSVPWQCGQLGAASIHVTKPRPQPLQREVQRGTNASSPSQMSYRINAPALDIYCLLLSHFLSPVAAASALAELWNSHR